MSWIETTPQDGAVALSAIPRLSYAQFYGALTEELACESVHVLSYFAHPTEEGLLLIALLGNDLKGSVQISSSLLDVQCEQVLPSLALRHPSLHVWEREMSENYGICFGDSPWDKPLRYAHDRFDRSRTIENYPFYKIEGASLHEVNVGPIHAGVIEPGCFRFIANGEQVLHLEIVLGYQHRGVERLIAASEHRLRAQVLCESIAGDSAVAHATAFAQNCEQLMGADCSYQMSPRIVERAIALEMERIAFHLSDTSALCGDIANQLGQVACEDLRTVVINTTQGWCGSRFGKGLVRPGGSYFPLESDYAKVLLENLGNVERRYKEVIASLENSPTLLARFEDCGVLSREQALSIGAVGMASRASGLERDIRKSHPWGVFKGLIAHQPITQQAGDVYARLQMRMQELLQSVEYVRQLVSYLNENPQPSTKPDYTTPLRGEMLSFSLVEGWRGEICHVAITDSQGQIAQYKIKDPSMQNWMGLALVMRGVGISDFPICNKSFNLSYCGHDL